MGLKPRSLTEVFSCAQTFKTCACCCTICTICIFILIIIILNPSLALRACSCFISTLQQSASAIQSQSDYRMSPPSAGKSPVHRGVTSNCGPPQTNVPRPPALPRTSSGGARVSGAKGIDHFCAPLHYPPLLSTPLRSRGLKTGPI